MQRDTDRGTDADNDDQSRLDENQDQGIHDDASDSRHEVHDDMGTLAQGPDQASHHRQMSHSNPPQLGSTPVNLKQSALNSSPTLTARRLALLVQFEQDLNAKAQAAGQVPTAGEQSLMWKEGMALTSDDVNDSASLTTETNKSSLQDSLKNSENKHQSDTEEDQYFDDQAPSVDGMDASSTESAPGDVENATRPILSGDGEDGTHASVVSAPGDVENVTRFLLTARRTSLANPPFGNSPLILTNFDDEETGVSSVSSLGDRVNGNRHTPLEDQADPTVASNHDTRVQEEDDNSERSFAVAVPVDNENDVTRPRAANIDPVAKTPLFKSLRFYFWLLISTLVLAAVAAVATVASLKLQAPSPVDNATRSASVEGTAEFSSFVALLGEAAFASADSHARQAAHWMIYEDEMRLTEASENLIQRFLLCFFYLATTQNAPWRSCGRSPAPEMINCTHQYLVDVAFSPKDGGGHRRYQKLLFENIASNRWLSSTHECFWAGVVCDPNYAVMGLDLGGQAIRATIPSELSLLSTLQGLVFYWNEFFGTLPSELAELSVLTRIEFNSNYLTGTIPQHWSDFPHMQLINIGDNLLSGTWPMGLNNVGSLRNVYVFENLISGVMQTEMALLSNLVQMRFSRNLLTGPVPTELGTLTALDELWLQGNGFSGTLPSELAKLSVLTDLRFHQNTLSGTIPEEYYGMVKLNRLELDDMNLTGTISTKIGNMTSLDLYSIRNNQLHGTIPTEMGLLTGLKTAWLHGNEITGSVPLELCALRSPRFFSVLIADCTPPDDPSTPHVECLYQCCTTCCTYGTKFCVDLDPVDP